MLLESYVHFSPHPNHKLRWHTSDYIPLHNYCITATMSYIWHIVNNLLLYTIFVEAGIKTSPHRHFLQTESMSHHPQCIFLCFFVTSMLESNCLFVIECVHFPLFSVWLDLTFRECQFLLYSPSGLNH